MPLILWNLKFHYPANNSSPLVLTVRYLTVAKQYSSVNPSKQ